LCGRLDVEMQTDYAVVEFLCRGIAGVDEHRHHAPVRRQHFGDESCDPAFAGGSRDMFKQYRAKSEALIVVAHRESDLGIVAVHPVVTGDSDELVAHQRNQRGPILVVDICEPLDVALR
jgi:hypothetical protein